jgi:hypothetical protein
VCSDVVICIFCVGVAGYRSAIIGRPVSLVHNDVACSTLLRQASAPFEALNDIGFFLADSAGGTRCSLYVGLRGLLDFLNTSGSDATAATPVKCNKCILCLFAQ